MALILGAQYFQLIPSEIAVAACACDCAFASAGAFAGSLAVAGAGAGEKLIKSGRSTLFYVCVIAYVVFANILILLLLDFTAISISKRAFFVLFAIFPLINALFDVVSYAVTFALIRIGLRSTRVPAVVFGVLDLLFAAVLFFALGVTLTIVVAGVNWLAGTELLPLGVILDDLSDGSLAPENRWIFFMIFSTLIPTALHLVTTLTSLASLWPLTLRTKVAGYFVAGSSGEPLPAVGALLGFTALTAVPFVLVYWAYWGLLLAFHGAFAAFGTWYLHELMAISSAVGV